MSLLWDHVRDMRELNNDCLGSWLYTDYAGLKIAVNSRIVWPFSRQIAISNGGPTTALESMGAKQYFRCHFLNIGQMYKQ